jgi:deferrochelatase/peroxidase EfeB
VSSVIPQPVVAKPTRAAIFLVVTLKPELQHREAIRALCGDLAALLRAVGFRDLKGRLSCVMAFGSDAWGRLFEQPRPIDLHPFREIKGQHHAVSTPGDILFHIRATKRMDLCFELATQIMSRICDAVVTVDEVHGFNALTTIVENAKQLEIMRDNMPFGDVGKGEFGTYFIGYARSPHRIEQMLSNMFVGRPPGNYDRLLDYSKAVTGTLFFVPSATFLANVVSEDVTSLPTSPSPYERGMDVGSESR